MLGHYLSTNAIFMLKGKFTIYIILMLAMSGCYKDHDIKEEETHIEETAVYINTNIVGKVENHKGDLIDNYKLKVGIDEYKIDKEFFNISLQGVRKKGQIIKAIKDDHTIGLSTMVIVENDYNKVIIDQLQESKMISGAGSFQIQLTEEITLSGNNKDTNIHLGYTKMEYDVAAYGQYGELLITTDAELIVIEGFSEEDYTIDHKNLRGRDLFESMEGQWKMIIQNPDRESLQNLKAGDYLLAASSPATLIQGSVNSDDKKITYLSMEGRSAYHTYSTYSTLSGQYVMLTPKNNEARVSCNNICGEEIYTTSIEVADKFQQVNIDCNGIEDQVYHLQTTVLNCQGSPAVNPIIILGQSEMTEEYIFDDGNVDHWLVGCQEDLMVSALDSQSHGSSPILKWDRSLKGDLGYLSSCDDHIDGYTYIQIDNEFKIYEPFVYTYENGKTMFSSEDGSVKFWILGNMKGLISAQDVNLYLDEKEIGGGYFVSCQNTELGCGMDKFTITQYDEDQGYIRAIFEGSIWMKSFDPLKADFFDVKGCILIRQD